MKTAESWIKELKLLPHPEGGYYREVYRSDERVAESALPSGFKGERCFSTAIFYLLTSADFSAFHRIKADEIWHFYDGDPLEIFSINTAGAMERFVLGKGLPDGELLKVVPRSTWFAARPAAGSLYALVGCTVSPGFDFADFEMASRESLLQDYPRHASFINQLTRC